MLRIPQNQVAGHQAATGQLGPVVDDSGLFYKPLQNAGRGSDELEFYTSFSSNPRIPKHIRNFFPKFYGTRVLEASDGSGLKPHMVLEDLMWNRIRPSVMDIKVGSRTWHPQFSEDYILKCLKKDRETTSLHLGFRISGLQVNRREELWKPERQALKDFSEGDVRLILRKFVSSNTCGDQISAPDSSYASTVYGGSSGILSKLLELKGWFEDQTIFHFYSCSVLISYSQSEDKCLRPEVKLIDFAHVMEGKGVIDHNFLGGLCSLIKFVEETLESTQDYSSVGV